MLIKKDQLSNYRNNPVLITWTGLSWSRSQSTSIKAVDFETSSHQLWEDSTADKSDC